MLFAGRAVADKQFMTDERKGLGSGDAQGTGDAGSEAPARKVCGQLQGRYPELFERYPVEDYIYLLDVTHQGESFYKMAPRVASFWHEVLDGYGPEGLETYNRVAMLALIDAFEERAAQHDYPQSVVDQFQLNFVRIKRNIFEAEIGTYLHSGDSFIKDFSICRQIAFPGGGAWTVDCHGGFPRATLLRGGIGQFFKFMFLFLFVTKGREPFYMAHVHNDLVRGHTAEEREACHLRIAEMLVHHPEIKGQCGIGWLVDPAVEDVSPRLAYIRKVPQENGAWVFRVGEDINSGALAKSPTRRKLYQEGKYMPTSYLYVWPRKKFIAWARRRA